MSASMRVGRTFVRNYYSKPDPDAHKPNPKLWRNLTLFMAVPIVVMTSVKTIVEELHHTLHMPDYIAYPYLNKKEKTYAWGPHGLFYNPRLNKRDNED